MATTPRRWLRDFALDVRGRLKATAHHPLLVLLPPGEIKEWETDTNGWYASIGRVKTFPGELQVWLDEFANAGGRRASVAFKSTRGEMIERLAEAGAGVSKAGATLDNRHWTTQGGIGRLKNPLPKHMYASPIKELYSPWSFYTWYFPDPVEPQLKKRPKLVKTAADFFQVVVGSATAIIVGNLEEDYSSVENRTDVKTHISRERNTTLAFKAKGRDGFTCQICRVSFPELYGKLGLGFAEVHHIVPLSSLNATGKTTLAQLLTLCANCHRMLHRLNGKKSDIGILKKAFTGKWPSTATK